MSIVSADPETGSLPCFTCCLLFKGWYPSDNVHQLSHVHVRVVHTQAEMLQASLAKKLKVQQKILQERSLEIIKNTEIIKSLKYIHTERIQVLKRAIEEKKQLVENVRQTAQNGQCTSIWTRSHRMVLEISTAASTRAAVLSRHCNYNVAGLAGLVRVFIHGACQSSHIPFPVPMRCIARPTYYWN